MTIVIADDEPALLSILRYNFVRAGFDVLTAPDGAHALALVREHLPDAAILDAMMPGLTGAEVCREVRRDPRTRAVRLVLLSAKGPEELAVMAGEAGADEFEVKPFSPVALVERVRLLLAA